MFRLCAIAYAGNATTGETMGELFEYVLYRDLLIDLGHGGLDGERRLKAGDSVRNRLDGWKRVYRLHFGTVIEGLRSRLDLLSCTIPRTTTCTHYYIQRPSRYHEELG
jgi:hypothetical protein